MNAVSHAASILSDMTLDEKLGLIVGVDNMYTKGVPRLGVRRVRMADASMGLRDDAIDATAFPAFIGLAATWNRDRAKEYGEAVGEEFRAAQIDVVLGPGVNLYRVHECGRNFEYLGEEPLLSAAMVVPYIRGVQSKGVAATVKHFACNNTDWHRCVSDSIVDERTLRECYLLPFEAAVKDAGVQCLMTSYNLVNGEYAGESHHLLTDILLGDWGFSGVIMSDWEGLWNPAPAATGGIHLEMPRAKAFNAAAIRTMLEEGVIAESDIDAKAARVLELTFKLEERRLEVPDRNAGPGEAHTRVALEVAREAVVLLRNEGDLLPLDASHSTIAVLGPLADPTPTSGGGAAAVRAIDAVSIAAAVAVATEHAGSGGRVIRPAGETDEASVLAAADVAVICVGFTGEREREGCDRPLDLPDGQVDLIKRASRTAKRTVVVVVAGGGVEMTSWVDDVDAIIHLWYPGAVGARALAEVIFGSVNPSGKLPISIERTPADRAAFANYLPEGAEHYAAPDYVSQNHDRFEVRYDEGVFCGYRYLDRSGTQPLFAFGHGLSYTSFTYADLAVTPGPQGLTVEFTVTNSGARDGLECAQVYLVAPAALASEVPRRLVGFEKRRVERGATERYRVTVPARAMASWDGSRWVVAAGTYVVQAGASSRDVRLETNVDMNTYIVDKRENVL